MSFCISHQLCPFTTWLRDTLDYKTIIWFSDVYCNILRWFLKKMQRFLESQNTPKKRSFGGIPNSSSIDIPSLTTWAPFCAIVLPMWTMLSPWSKQSITWLLLSRLQGNKPHRNSPEPSEPCLRNLHQHTPELFGTLRNLPNPASGTFRNLPPEPTILHRNSPEPYRNLPPEPTPADARTLRNSPQPSGTFRNLPPEPAPAPRPGTHRSLSGLKTPLACAVGEKHQIGKIIGKVKIVSLRLTWRNPFPREPLPAFVSDLLPSWSQVLTITYLVPVHHRYAMQTSIVVNHMVPQC